MSGDKAIEGAVKLSDLKTVDRLAALIQLETLNARVAYRTGRVNGARRALDKIKRAMLDANRLGVRELLAAELNRRGYGASL